MSSSPQAGLEVILNIPPLVIHLKTQALITYKRLLVNGNWRVQEGEIRNKKNHTNIIKKLAKNLKLLHTPRDKMMNTAYIQTGFKTEIQERIIINQVMKRPGTVEVGAVNCFTDGSRFDNRSGYGYTIQGDGIKVNGYNSLGEYATVYQAELIAIQEAAFTMLGKEVRGKRITIYVDNQAAIQPLGSYQIRGRIAA